MGAISRSKPARPAVSDLSVSDLAHKRALPEETDEDLMERISVGDRIAFRNLAARYTGLLYAAASRMNPNRPDAEDIVQESLLRLWQKAGTWRPDGGASVKTWLYRIAFNLAVDQQRRKNTEKRAAPQLVEEDDHRTPERAMQDDELGQAVSKALAALPERQRTALVLCHYQGLSNAEAAAVMGTSVKGVEGLLVRARRTMALDLEPLRGQL